MVAQVSTETLELSQSVSHCNSSTSHQGWARFGPCLKRDWYPCDEFQTTERRTSKPIIKVDNNSITNNNALVMTKKSDFADCLNADCES